MTLKKGKSKKKKRGRDRERKREVKEICFDFPLFSFVFLSSHF